MSKQSPIEKKDCYDFKDFVKIMEILLGKDGCPWDKAQTHESLKRYLIEECYEVLEAIDKKDNKNLCEELGDVLLQVIFHSILGEKSNEFSLSDVIDAVSKKMIYRHPHIFSDTTAETAEDVLTNWEDLKKKEKGYKSQTDVLNSVPKNLPALMRAEKVLKKSETDKDKNEKSLTAAINKLKDAVNNINTNSFADNEYPENLIGEILLNTVNISKFLKINPEFALTNATEKFINRFEYIDSKPF